MLGATHLLVGASIYESMRRKAKNQQRKTKVNHNRGILKTIYCDPTDLLVYSLAFFSHFLLDAIPHFELSVTQNYILGAIAGCFLAYKTLRKRVLGIFIAGALGGLPDILWLSGLSPGFNRIHNDLHFTSASTIPMYLLITEGILSVWAIWVQIKRK